MLKMALSLQTSSENRLQCSCVFCCVPVRSAVLLCILPCSCVFCRAPACSVCSVVLLCILPCSCVFCRAPSCSVCSAVRLCVLQCSCVLCRAPECCAVLLWSPGSAPPRSVTSERPPKIRHRKSTPKNPPKRGPPRIRQTERGPKIRHNDHRDDPHGRTQEHGRTGARQNTQEHGRTHPARTPARTLRHTCAADQQQSILHKPSGQKRRFPFLSGQVPLKMAVSLETSWKNGDVGRCCCKTFYVENGRFA